VVQPPDGVAAAFQVVGVFPFVGLSVKGSVEEREHVAPLGFLHPLQVGCGSAVEGSDGDDLGGVKLVSDMAELVRNSADTASLHVTGVETSQHHFNVDYPVIIFNYLRLRHYSYVPSYLANYNLQIRSYLKMKEWEINQSHLKLEINLLY